MRRPTGDRTRDSDHFLAPEIEAVVGLVASGPLMDAAEAVTGELW